MAVVSSAAVFSLIGRLYSEGLRRLTTCPSGSMTRLQICGFVRLPPVGDRRGNLGHLQRRHRQTLLADRHPCEVDPSAGTEQVFSSKTPLFSTWSSGRSIAGVALKPKRSM